MSVAAASVFLGAGVLVASCADTRPAAEPEPIAKPLRQYMQVVDNETARIVDLARNAKK